MTVAPLWAADDSVNVPYMAGAKSPAVSYQLGVATFDANLGLGDFAANASTTRLGHWGNRSMAYAVNTTDLSSSWLDLSCTVSAVGDVIKCQNQLVTTRLPSGGLRWWFICPLVTNGQVCRVRVKKLYLPPGARYFGCWRCYDLTYTSCQTHDKRFRSLRTQLREAVG